MNVIIWSKEELKIKNNKKVVINFNLIKVIYDFFIKLDLNKYSMKKKS